MSFEKCVRQRYALSPAGELLPQPGNDQNGDDCHYREDDVPVLSILAAGFPHGVVVIGVVWHGDKSGTESGISQAQ